MIKIEDKNKLINEVKALYEEFGTIPNAIDWCIYTESKWWTCYNTWTDFLVAAGIVDDSGVTYKPHIIPRDKCSEREKKLCRLLRVVEQRGERPCTKEGWSILLKQMHCNANNGGFPVFYGVTQRWGSRPSIEWDRNAYMEGLKPGNKFFYGYWSNPALSDDGWLSFRYAAGVQDYSYNDLVSLGVSRLKQLISNVETGKKYNCEGRRTTNDLDLGVLLLAEDIKDLNAEKILANNQLRIALSDNLPHLAIYDHFGTFKEYLRVILDKTMTGEVLKPAQCELRIEEDSIEEIMNSLKSLTKKLSYLTGFEVQIVMK